MVSELNEHRRDFWQFFAERLPALYGRMVRGNEHSRWLFVGHRPLVIAHYIANRGVGLFVRGPTGERTWRTREYLFPHREFLAVTRCLVPLCNGISLADASWRDRLWYRYFTAAPRPRTLTTSVFSG
jgi:hypothetical protein